MTKLIATLAAIILLTFPLLADTIHVPGDYTTIQAGIDAAVNGDTVLVADGTYTGTGNKNIDFGGRAIVVVSENGPENCVIDCEDDGRGFYFHSGENPFSILSGFKIINGDAANLPLQRGGGIYCESNSDPTIENCIISENSADWGGGGIYCSEVSPAIVNCVISDNSTIGCGGGIHCYGSVVIITNCTISRNSGGYGGGICCDEANSIIENCVISGNSANDGAGIACGTFSSPIIEKCTITDNSSEMSGGGIHCYKFSSPNITLCTINGNSAEGWTGGGGIYTSESSLVIANSTICYNWAEDGGGIYFSASSPTLANCTVSGNFSAGVGGGIDCSPFSNLTMVNAIVEGNTGNGGIHFGYSTDASITYGDFHNNQNGNFSGSPPPGLGVVFGVNANGDSCDAFYNIFEDPLFEDPMNGNFQITWANFPVPDSTKSSCIDAGDPVSPPDPDGTVADMGAYYFDQSGTPVLEPEISLKPNKYSLHPPHPNPFNPMTAISYQLQAAGYVKLAVYDVQGREVERLVDGWTPAGFYQMTFDASQLSSGIYFARLMAGNFDQTRKLLLIK